MHFHIQGLDCPEEVAILKRQLSPLVGGEDRLSFDILNAKMSVLVSDAAVTSRAVSPSLLNPPPRG